MLLHKVFFPFHGQSIISDTDLKAVLGASSVERDNWLSNFVVDQYLEIMRNTNSKDDFKIKTITWERFKRAVATVPAREFGRKEIHCGTKILSMSHAIQLTVNTGLPWH